MLREVKRSQGSPAARRLPFMDSLLLVIHQVLDLTNFDHCVVWAACMLGCFGFLRSAEFTVPNLASFSPATHLSVASLSPCSDKSVKDRSVPSRMPHPYWSGKGTPLHSSGIAGLPLPAGKCPCPGVLIGEWSTSVPLNPD